jgi:REP element-mobilizing transposase RayT
LPRELIDQIERQRTEWKHSHAMDRLSDEEKGEYHRLFSQYYEDLLNAGSGSCVLREPENAKIVENALQFFEVKRYELDERIIMPNHVHLPVKPLSGFRLVNILHSWKSFTANKINRRSGKSGQLWQHESYDHIVRNERAMEAIRRYIIENPKAK